jgi:hypothetical membrane protein
MRPAAVSSALAPVALIGGFTLGAARQPASYDSARDTISALAARGATDRWIMSLAFVLLGCCHLVTAAGLDRAAAARGTLAIGGLATAALALAPQPARGSSDAHVLLAAIALVGLATWPLAGTRSDRFAALGLIVLLIAFGVALHADAAVGAAERLLTVAQALWPIVAVHTSRPLRGVRAVRQAGRGAAGPP